MSEDTEPKRANLGGLVMGVVVTLAILYILAPGPLSYFFKSGAPEGVSQVVRFLFAPIGFLYQHLDFIRAFYDWYFSLFP